MNLRCNIFKLNFFKLLKSIRKIFSLIKFKVLFEKLSSFLKLRRNLSKKLKKKLSLNKTTAKFIKKLKSR